MRVQTIIIILSETHVSNDFNYLYIVYTLGEVGFEIN